MKNKVLIITHGLFGVELKKSAEMIMGEQESVDALGLVPGQSVDDLREKAFEIVEKNDAEGVHTIIMCDLMGGSPSNVALACVGKADCDVLLGVSMPMLLEAIQAFDFDHEGSALAETALAAGQAGARLINRSTLKKND